MVVGRLTPMSPSPSSQVSGSASGPGLSVNLTTLPRAPPASPPPRSPRRIKLDSTTPPRSSDSGSTPGSPTPSAVLSSSTSGPAAATPVTAPLQTRSTGAAGSGTWTTLTTSSNNNHNNGGSSSSSAGTASGSASALSSSLTKDMGTVRASALASLAESSARSRSRSRSGASIGGRTSSMDLARSSPRPPSTSAAAGLEAAEEQAETAASAAAAPDAGSGDTSTSSLADSSMMAMHRIGSALQSSAGTSQRRSDLTVDTSLQSVSVASSADDSVSSDRAPPPRSGSGSEGSSTGLDKSNIQTATDSITASTPSLNSANYTATSSSSFGQQSTAPSAWSGMAAVTTASATSSPFCAASPILGSAGASNSSTTNSFSSATPTATSASGHSASSSHGGQSHIKTLGRLSRLTYARNDGVSVFGIGGPHGGGKGWSDYSAPSSAAPRSPSLSSASNSFAASFGAANAANGTAAGGGAAGGGAGAGNGAGAPSVAGSSRGGSISITSGMSSVRGSVDANGSSAGTPLGMAIANAQAHAAAAAAATAAVSASSSNGGVVAGSHGLTLGLSLAGSQHGGASPGVTGHPAGGSGTTGIDPTALSSPAPYKLLSAALVSARNSLPVGGQRADLSPGLGREKDLADRLPLAAVEEGIVAHENAWSGQDAGTMLAEGQETSDSLTGLGIEHTPGSRAAYRAAIGAGGPRVSLPSLSGLPPQRELLLPALQSVRSAFEGNDHRRDTFSFGSGSGFAGQRPLSALMDDPAALASAALNTSKDDGHAPPPSSAVSSLLSSGVRSTSSFGWSRNGENHGRDSVSPPTTSESVGSSRMSLKEPMHVERERMRLNRKPSHPTLVEEVEQPPSLPEDFKPTPMVSSTQMPEHGAISADSLMDAQVGHGGRTSQDGREPRTRRDSSAGSRGIAAGRSGAPVSNGDIALPDGIRARLFPGPEDEIDGLTIGRRPEGGYTYLDANGQPLGSKTVLTLAIEKAQSAVLLDSSNQVPEAIRAYKHALRLLEEVMERIAPKPGQRPKPNREEERRRLVIIHDTYADRIRLLSAIRSNPQRSSHAAKASLSQQAQQRGRSEAPSSFNADMIPQRPKGHTGTEQPHRSDGFHEALAAANAEMQDERRSSMRSGDTERGGVLRNAASSDLLRTRRPSAYSTHRPMSLTVQPDSQASDIHQAQFTGSEDTMGSSFSSATGAGAGRYNFGDDSKRDSLATALSSHTLTPRNHLAQTAAAEKKLHLQQQHQQRQQDIEQAQPQDMPKISIQPESPVTRQARLTEVPVTSEIVLGSSNKTMKAPQGRPEGSGHGRTDSEGSGRSHSRSWRRSTSTTSPSRQRSIPDGLKTPTTPYFDTSSQLHLDESELSPKPSSRPVSEWSAHPSDSGLGEKERTNTLGVGLMSPPQLLGESGDNQRLRPLSAYTEGGASQSASDGHPSEAGADLDRALAGLDASLSQLSHERMHGTVKVTGRRQLRVSLHSTVAGGDKVAAAAVAAAGAASVMSAAQQVDVTDASAGVGTGTRRQKATSSASKPENMSVDRSDPSRAPTEFPRMGGPDGDAGPEVEPPRVAGSSGRQRSSSQPAPKRPPIPFSFMNGGPQPPMPRLTRKGSTSSNHVPSPTAAASSSAAPRSGFGLSNSIRPGPGGQSGFRFPSPAPSATSTFAAPEMPMLAASTYLDENGHAKGSGFDLFPSGLPSVQYSGVPSFATATSNSALPGVDIDPGAHDYSHLFPMPANVIMRPFFVIRQLQSSLFDGAHFTRKLYVPRNLWDSAQQAGVKIALLDLKVRMLDLVATGMEPVEAGGKALLQPPIVSQPGLLAVQATRFARQLDDFELLLLDVQNTLASKMSSVEPVTGKKSKNAFGSLSSRLKLKGSFGGLTSSHKNLDSPSDYIFSLTRVCAKLGHLDQHVHSILRAQSGLTENDARGPGTETYAALPTEVRLSIEAKLKRTSDWLANVLLCFVLRDISLVLDRYTKRASIPFIEG